MASRSALATALSACAAVAGLLVSTAASAEHRTSTSSCILSRFHVSVGPEVSEQTQQHTLVLRLTNRGGTSCVLGGYPSIALYDGSGKIPFPIRHHDQMIAARTPRSLRVDPGEGVFVVINKNVCILGMTRGSRRTTRIAINLPGRPVADGASINFPPGSNQQADPPEYCGRGYGRTLAVSPFVATVGQALG